MIGRSQPSYWMNLTLQEIAEYVGGQLTPAPGPVEAVGYSIDSRTTQPGDLFFAIRGPRFDGHDFVGAARDRGARAAVIARDSAVSEPGLPFIRVDSPARALGQLALAVRQRWGRLVIGVTGSVGKTTTKEMIAALLEARFRILRSQGNLNNELGLPLSLLRVGDAHDVMVLEMGMSAAGEIRKLAAIALPNEGVVTNVNPVHLEFFDSIDGIAAAKAELIDALVDNGQGKRAYLNADDTRVSRMADGFGGEVVTWGKAANALFRVTEISSLGLGGTTFTLRHGHAEVQFRSPLAGLHNVSNAAAAIAVAATHGVGWEELRRRVRKFSTTGLRGVVTRYSEGFVTVDDSYNSNPAALVEMVRLVGALPEFTRRILVAGEMLELGDQSPQLHAECGRVAREAGFDLIVAVQGNAREILTGARKAGAPDECLIFVDSAEEAGEVLAARIRSGDVVLFKGSRGVGLDRAASALNRRFAAVES